MPIKKTIYVCQYCGEYAPYMDSKAGIPAYNYVKAHEENYCWKNPELKTCLTCLHFVKPFKYQVRTCMIYSPSSTQICHNARGQLKKLPYGCLHWEKKRERGKRARVKDES